MALVPNQALNALHGREHELGIAVSLTPRILLQKPAPARALNDGSADGLVNALRVVAGIVRDRG